MSPPSPDSGPLPLEELRRVDEFISETPVDEATVWLETEDGDSLEAIYNPVNDTLPGSRQPLSRGLISQVFVTGLPLLERDVSQRRSHDPHIDSLTGCPTRSLLAAPITAGDEIVGVVSAVRLVGRDHDRELQDDDLAQLDHLARALGKTITRHSDPKQSRQP